MEMDCLLRRSNWLSDLLEEVAAHPPFAILGSFFRSDAWPAGLGLLAIPSCPYALRNWHLSFFSIYYYFIVLTVDQNERVLFHLFSFQCSEECSLSVQIAMRRNLRMSFYWYVYSYGMYIYWNDVLKNKFLQGFFILCTRSLFR